MAKENEVKQARAGLTEEKGGCEICLSPEKAFYFWAGDRFLGVRAASLDEFAALLRMVEAESITFHLGRKDFQNWLTNELKLPELAKALDQIKLNQEPEKIRKEIVQLVEAKIQ